MTLVCWLKRWECLWGRVAAKHTHLAKHRKPVFYRRPCLEELETRQLPSANPLSSVSAIGPNTGRSQASAISQIATDKEVYLAVGNIAGQRAFVFVNQLTNEIKVQDVQSGQISHLASTPGLPDHEDFAVADLNGDGNPDLIVANGYGNNIFVYLGLPSGQFASPREFSVGADPVNITVSDLNGDGVPDLVVVNKQSNDLSILFGQEHGENWTLTSGPTLHVGLCDLWMLTTIAYINGERGIPDILVANSASNNVYLLRGEGAGAFDDTNPVIYQTGKDPEQVIVGQFSGGSRLDFVTVNAGSKDLTLFPGFEGWDGQIECR